MAIRPAKKSAQLSPAKASMGPKLIGFGAALFVLTRIIIWLPLGLLGTWINGVLWPVLLLSVAGGAGLMYLKSKRS